MRTVSVLMLLAALTVMGLPNAAEAPQTSAEQTAPAAESAQETKADEQTEANTKKVDEQTAETKSQERPAAGQKPSPQRFIPSEQVRADFDVSFPIDI